MDDGKLLKRMRSDDQDAFQTLFERYARYAAAVAARVGGSRLTVWDVEEICSDVFFTLWQKRASITLTGGTLKPYIGTLARNRALNALRNNRAHVDSQLCETAAAEPSAEDRYLQQEKRGTLSQAIADVKASDRELFVRRYLYQERVTDIAEDKGLNVKTASTRILKARKQVALIMKKLGG